MKQDILRVYSMIMIHKKKEIAAIVNKGQADASPDIKKKILIPDISANIVYTQHLLNVFINICNKDM